MADSLFLPLSDLTWFVNLAGTFVAYGLGLAFCVWAIGYVIAFLIDVLRF